MGKDVKVNIPDHLFGQLKSYLKKTAFNSVDDFVTFVLQDYLDQNDPQENKNLSQDETEEITKRLENLGYL
ncbi:MAG: hypothetical protein K8R79_10000 [Calditrichales bacterium]|nr:hypothetical protein [Calditrichales bacterium]